MRPGRDHAARAHRDADRHAGAAEGAGGAVDQQGLARKQPAGQQSAIRDEQGPERAPFAGVGRIDGADQADILGRHPHLLGEGAVVIVALQAERRLAAGGQDPAG